MKSVEDLGVSPGKWYVGGEEDCITKTKLKGERQ